jgi:hypothetical protein
MLNLRYHHLGMHLSPDPEVIEANAHSATIRWKYLDVTLSRRW